MTRMTLNCVKCGLWLLTGLLLLLVVFPSEATNSDHQPPPRPPLDIKRFDAPIIGALTQVLRDYKAFTNEPRLHLVSSYVKWLEMAGAQVVPILLNQNDSYYEQMFRLTNGLLLPGGDNLLDPHKNTPMMQAAKKLYRLAVEANDAGDFYPIWGTCLGLELLTVLESGKNELVDCDTNDFALPTSFVARGRMFAPAAYMNITGSGDYSKQMMNALSTGNISYHYHHKCVTDLTLAKTNLTDFYKPLAYSKDGNGLKFVSVMEANNYPFYAVQFHPEKPAFEFTIRPYQTVIPHTRPAIAASRYFSDFLVQLARRNNHLAPTPEILDKFIYSYDPLYTAPLTDMYEQRYLFPYTDNGLTMEEFLDFIPDAEHPAPEDVSKPQRYGTSR